jgi:hypothetical protein
LRFSVILCVSVSPEVGQKALRREISVGLFSLFLYLEFIHFY